MSRTQPASGSLSSLKIRRSQIHPSRRAFAAQNRAIKTNYTLPTRSLPTMAEITAAMVKQAERRHPTADDGVQKSAQRSGWRSGSRQAESPRSRQEIHGQTARPRHQRGSPWRLCQRGRQSRHDGRAAMRVGPRFDEPGFHPAGQRLGSAIGNRPRRQNGRRALVAAFAFQERLHPRAAARRAAE